MNKIPKCKTRQIALTQKLQYLKVNKKNSSKKENIPQQRIKTKFESHENGRKFGNDITITVKNYTKNDNHKFLNTSINSNKVSKN